MHIPLSLRCPISSAEPGKWSELQQHIAEHLRDVSKNDGLRDAFLGQAQAGGRSARAGPSSGETGSGMVYAAELRELTATIFKTYLVPGSESVAEAMAEAGRLYHEVT